ncbi:MAG: anhydro-N-acetylmuramic acid kinase [Halieaceae bacterium]|jgi:anhydro-N-acetylmuramic acid kinase|nr:anhydro-N-acetylmuramic acid kinase [Halieaceae bacterium]
MPARLLVGLMSGTSMDGIDAVLVDPHAGLEVLATQCAPLPPELKQAIHALSHPGENEVFRLGQLDIALGREFAAAAQAVIRQAGAAPGDVRAIGSHGQTIRHHPASSGSEVPFTLQIGDPNTIAELTGITTVADFRRRDMAAGGEGAPLVPAFHQAMFGDPKINRAIVNIGGIANVTLLQGENVRGYDTGPGNTLLDQWAARHLGTAFDAGGSWSAEGAVNTALLDTLLAHPYFTLQGPKSTGKEAFNLAWLDEQLAGFEAIAPIDVQATLCAFTATAISRALSDETLDEIYVCGGGAANTDLMRRLYQAQQPRPLHTTDVLGCDPDWVEACAFAWLAGQRLDGAAANAPAVTGARGPRVLGAIYPGDSCSPGTE